PRGTPFAVTEATMLEIEEAANLVQQELATDSGSTIFESVSVSLGETSRQGFSVSGLGDNQAGHLGQMTIQLVPSDFRDISSSQIESLIRRRIQDLPNIDKLEFQSSPVGDEPDIEVE